jgi:hypothetical protein
MVTTSPSSRKMATAVRTVPRDTPCSCCRQYKHGQRIPAASLMSEHKVSRQVACAALAMLAANRYVTQQAPFKPYQVTWHAARSKERE